MKRVLVTASLLAGAPFAVLAQDAWVQIEAERSRTEAMARAEFYATMSPDVAGFTLGSGWYAVALGPFTEAEAEAALRNLRAQGAIPADSYIVTSRAYRDQFWPGAGAVPATAPEATAVDAAQAQTTPPPEPQTPDETVQQARASEAALTLPEKQLLQVALKWSGHYQGTIDGLFGRGTRGSMSAWQAANGHAETGVLTTGQRAQLIAAYNAVLDGMGLARVESADAGIAMQIPTEIVSFDRFDPPFAVYGPSGGLQAQVILISQQGDSQRLAGLYQIMQTLEIVPQEGPRSLRRDGFTLEGADATRHSYSEVQLQGDQIKGFTLVWPAGDEERRSRVLAEMRSSFERIDGVLDPAIVPASETQSADLISGLQVRQPRMTRSGVFIDAQGTVLTSASAVANCGNVELGNTPATVTLSDADLGIAVLRPTQALSPASHASFDTRVPRLGSRAVLAGFPYGGVLPRAALTFGSVSDLRSLDGDERFSRLAMATTDSEAGAPVFNDFGGVIGLLSEANTGKQLPEGVAFALKSATLVETLAAAGITVSELGNDTPKDAVALTDLGGQIAVPVRCWE